MEGGREVGLSTKRGQRHPHNSLQPTKRQSSFMNILTMQKTSFTFSVIIFLATFSFCYGQSPPPPPPPPPPAKPVKIVGKAEVFYFKKTNRSRVNVDFTLLGSMKNILREDVFQVTASLTAQGEKITRPQAINLMLYSHTHGTDYRYKDDHQVELLIDGKLIGSGPATLAFHAIDPRGGVTESYNIGMPFEVLAQLLTAKAAKLKFGTTMFDLNAEAIAALKDLQRAIE
jgi:hypothetical protein